jgi:Fe-S-cluster containining protein
MTKGCNGCTDCCKAIGVRGMSSSKEKQKKLSNSIPSGWERITKRQAKKRNPFMFSKGSWKSYSTYFKCNHLTDNGCSIHKSSPYVCSGYPYYGRSLIDFKGLYSEEAYKFEYSNSCNLTKEMLELTDTTYDGYLLKHFKSFIENYGDMLHKGRNEFPDRIASVDITEVNNSPQLG